MASLSLRLGNSDTDTQMLVALQQMYFIFSRTGYTDPALMCLIALDVAMSYHGNQTSSAS